MCLLHHKTLNPQSVEGIRLDGFPEFRKFFADLVTRVFNRLNWWV